MDYSTYRSSVHAPTGTQSPLQKRVQIHEGQNEKTTGIVDKNNLLLSHTF